jgi:hypothetical protein
LLKEARMILVQLNLFQLQEYVRWRTKTD